MCQPRQRVRLKIRFFFLPSPSNLLVFPHRLIPNAAMLGTTVRRPLVFFHLKQIHGPLGGTLEPLVEFNLGPRADVFGPDPEEDFLGTCRDFLRFLRSLVRNFWVLKGCCCCHWEWEDISAHNEGGIICFQFEKYPIYTSGKRNLQIIF